MKKKNKLISLEAYRKKKQKLSLRKAKKVSSDKALFFEEDRRLPDENPIPFQEETKVYYMKNYLKRKKPFSNLKIGSQEKFLVSHPSKEKLAKIIQLSEYKKTKSSQASQWSQENKRLFKNSKPSSLEAYRKKKAGLQDHKKDSFFPKEILAYGAVALMMLFALNIWFPKGQDQGFFFNNQLATRSSSYFQAGRTKRALASPSLLQDKPKVIIGKKPSSSVYKGF